MSGAARPAVDRLLFWGPRLLALALLVVAGLLAERQPGGRDLASALVALALGGVSVLASWWIALGLWSVALAAALALPLERWLPPPWGAPLREAVIQLNRQAGHVEALFTWALIVLLPASLPWQLGAVGAVVAFGPAAVDAAGRWRLRRAGREGRDELHAGRRPFIYASTLLGLALVLALAPRQWRAVLPLLTAVAAGAVVRWICFARFTSPGDARHRAAVEDGRRLDRAVLLLGAGLAALLPLLRQPAPDDLPRRACHWVQCAADPGPAEVSLFLVSDSQLHALSGLPSGFQVGLVDSVVPVAVRPVELDLLSGATLLHFAGLYHRLAADLPGLPWAYLGDAGDVGCQGELEAFAGLAADFAPGRLAGIAPGNHDSAFMGNLFWHPQWSSACGGPPAWRRWALARLRSLAAPGGAVTSDPADGFLASVASLGRAGGREVQAAFLDTSDYGLFGLGIAGVQGDLTRGQERWLLGHLAPDSLVVLFLHHPVGHLASSGQRVVERLAAALGDRLLLVVSAHTHFAAWHDPAGRLPAEVVVGSTTDAPQEAAILRVGHAGGRAWASVRTLAAVAREAPPAPPGGAAGRDLTCGREPERPGAARCREVLDGLGRRAACADLLGNGSGGFLAAVARQEPCSDCAPAASGQACDLASRAGGMLRRGLDGAVDFRCDRQRRAFNLIRCLEGDDGGLATPALPLASPEVGRRMADLYRRSGVPFGPAAVERRDAIVCLGWAASALQSHKHQGWTFATALALAFDDAAAPGELRAVGSTPPAAGDGLPACTGP